MHKQTIAVLLTAAALSSCGERQISAPGIVAEGPPAMAPSSLNLQRIDCTGRLDTKEIRCARPAMSPSDLIIGGQGTYVTLTSSNVVYNAATTAFTFDVSVTNLIPQALGTTDGTTPDPNGLRVFFSDGPTVTSGTGNASVSTPDGTDTFTGSNQPYYAYTSGLLGADGLLTQGETSGIKPWTLAIDATVQSFAFHVYVSANVQYPNGYVDVTSPSPYLVASGVQSLAAVARTAVGNPVDAATFTYGTSAPAVATVDGTGAITAVAPGIATISVTSSTSTTGSVTVQVCPNLAVGEVYITSGPAAASTCLAGGASGTAEYTIIPFNTSTTSARSLTVTGLGITGVTGPPSPRTVPTEEDVLRVGSLDGPGASSTGMYGATEVPLPSFAAARARYAAGPFAGFDNDVDPSVAVRAGPRLSDVYAQFAEQRWAEARGEPAAFAEPAVGELVPYNVAQGCSGGRDVRTGRVRSVSVHAVIVADTANPAGGFTTAQYDSIALEFDSLVYPTVTKHFAVPTAVRDANNQEVGEITDVDVNGRVVLFFTRAVNELTPPASSPTTFGYFTNRDAFAQSEEYCTRSNYAEMLYMSVPDPTGAVNSNARQVSLVRSNVISRAAHELTRLVNAFRRIYYSDAFSYEEAWLDETLGHLAEELLFYRTAPGLTPRQNIDLSALTTGPFGSRRVAAFNAYANPDFQRLRPWMQRPDTVGVAGRTSIAALGVSWGFLRYAADRYALANGQSNDVAFVQALAGSRVAGMANIQNVIGVAPSEWLRDWQIAIYADDVGLGVPSRYTNPSWQYRSIFGGLGGFPLGTRLLTNNTALTLSYGRGANTFIRAGVPATSFATIAVREGGQPPPGVIMLSVLRTK